MQRTRAPSKGKGTAARRLGSCREVEELTAFLGGQHSMGCELHTVVTKSVEVSDHRVPQTPICYRNGLGTFLFPVPRKDGAPFDGRTAACLRVSQLGRAEGSFRKTE